jgi:hypothetical protein
MFGQNHNLKRNSEFEQAVGPTPLEMKERILVQLLRMKTRRKSFLFAV